MSSCSRIRSELPLVEQTLLLVLIVLLVLMLLLLPVMLLVLLPLLVPLPLLLAGTVTVTGTAPYMTDARDGRPAGQPGVGQPAGGGHQCLNW